MNASDEWRKSLPESLRASMVQSLAVHIRDSTVLSTADRQMAEIHSKRIENRAFEEAKTYERYTRLNRIYFEALEYGIIYELPPGKDQQLTLFSANKPRESTPSAFLSEPMDKSDSSEAPSNPKLAFRAFKIRQPPETLESQPSIQMLETYDEDVNTRSYMICASDEPKYQMIVPHMKICRYKKDRHGHSRIEIIPRDQAYPSEISRREIEEIEVAKLLQLIAKMRTLSGAFKGLRYLEARLGEVETSLLTGHYRTPWEAVKDIHIAMEENPSYFRSEDTSEMKDLMDNCRGEVTKTMQDLGYCCGLYGVHLKHLRCANFCHILPKQVYYESKASKTPEYLCEPCYKHLGRKSPQPQNGPTKETPGKTSYLKKINDEKVEEPLVICIKCHREWHKICAFTHNENFVCPTCSATFNLPPNKTFFRASDLPRTCLSNHIQERVDKYLERANLTENKITIRMISNTMKSCEVISLFRNHFPQMPESLPYREKAILSFVEIDGYDVMNFGFYVHEYGSDCPSPNTGCVYVAFLDSVRYEPLPKELRTQLYYEILFGYLEHAKRRGFRTVHLWSQPPEEKHDFIFFRHPEYQIYLPTEALSKWYQVFSQKAVEQGILKEWKFMPEYYLPKPNWPKTFPYFQDDFWPTYYDKAIPSIARQVCGATCGSSLDANALFEEKFITRMKNEMKNHKGEFLVLTLNDDVNQVSHIFDPDGLIPSQIASDHEAFIEASRKEFLEHSTLRRAKWTAQCILKKLYEQFKIKY